MTETTKGFIETHDQPSSMVESPDDLSDSSVQTESVFERITDGFFAVDSAWRYTYVNENAAALVGRSKTDLVGEPVWDVFPELHDTLFAETLRTAMNTQETASIEDYFSPHDTWYSMTAYPEADGISIYFRDTTGTDKLDRHFEAIFNNTYTFVGLLKPDGTLLEANETALSFGGLDSADVVGMPVWETYWFQSNDEARSSARTAVERAANGEPYRDEIRVQGSDREVVIDFTVRPVTDDEGAVTLLIPEGRDVTEKKRYVQRLERLVDTLPGIVYRCRNEPGWPMETIRGEVEAMTGYPADVFRTGAGLYGNEVIHPDDRAAVWNVVQESLDARSSFEVTYRIVTSDGETRWFWERGQGVYALNGELEALEGFITDITDRKRAMEGLREERDFITQAIDSLDDLFYVVGMDGELRRWNNRIREVSGYSDDEIAEMRADEFFPPEERDRVNAAIEETLETGRTVVEFEFRTADGERIPYEFTGSKLVDTEGNPVGLVGVGRDITDKRARERELENQREHLAALNSLNTVVRDITDAVIEQSSRREIERATCEKLAASDSYAFSCIAAADPETLDLSPDVLVCDESAPENPKQVTLSDEQPVRDLARETMRSGETNVTRNGIGDNAFSSWQDGPTAPAGSSSTGSSSTGSSSAGSSFALVPIVHDTTRYGVIGIHSERAEAFATAELEIVSRLGEVIGYAFYALERRETLGTAIELEFRSAQIARPFLEHGVGEEGATLDAFIPLSEDEYLEYWTISEGNSKAFQRAVEALPFKIESSLISTIDGTSRFEVFAGPHSIAKTIADTGGTLTSGEFVNDALVFRGEFPESVDPASVSSAFQELFPDVELVSQQRILTQQYLRQIVDENLTERQKTILQLAHHGDYFDQPRPRTGEELADHLGITKQTFHHHLRNAEATVFELLFDEPDDPLI